MAVVLDAMVEQVSRTAADHSLLAAAQASDQAAAAAAAIDAALSHNGNSLLAPSQLAADQHQRKKIVHEGDAITATAVGLLTGDLQECLLGLLQRLFCSCIRAVVRAPLTV